MNTPCDWPVVYPDCDGDDVPDLPTDASPGMHEQSEQMAVDFLWNLTGQVYGVCPETVRPCREGCGSSGSTWKGNGSPWTPALIGGQWYNLTCGSCPPTASGCSCGDDATTIRLPGPIASVTQILIDGEILPSTAYRVDNYNILVRVDGGTWPSCQDLAAPTTEDGTWEITYERGRPVPVGGQVAAGALAEEFVKALCDDSSCRLPRRVQSITRQGVSMAILDSFEDIEKGHTGIWMIDSWVASVMAPKRGGSVASPDVGRYRNAPTYLRRTTWSAN